MSAVRTIVDGYFYPVSARYHWTVVATGERVNPPVEPDNSVFIRDLWVHTGDYEMELLADHLTPAAALEVINAHCN